MPIHVEIDPRLPNLVIDRMQGRWSWDEFHAAWGEIIDLSKQFNGERWDVISVGYDLVMPPGDPIKHAQTEFRRAMLNKLGTNAVVTESGLFRTLSKMGLMIFPEFRSLLQVAPNEESALRMIAIDRERDMQLFERA
jgi:hypothetical protein